LKEQIRSHEDELIRIRNKISSASDSVQALEPRHLEHKKALEVAKKALREVSLEHKKREREVAHQQEQYEAYLAKIEELRMQ
jgi:chromosome segregation ATPase